ncbi:molybdate ABC transporter substrate-binding protein [Actibacterium sp. 188UL27-1]|uniref:molybdate ABC transporter substrate-binding protein n=1 Tax=Actibacterium sp. 188UL27-1 TaxID=2786961 RepID=UPI0019566BBE|nr:molybdate ABC transporter substrate-binding protein [Actibacterium sp. 188UL27-1]MBM7067470.1 molybdate ABC transporter substrate-binding protein [Actibacterium sp. 188UL27-1]
MGGLLALAGFFSVPCHADDLTVFAAASLKTALDEVAGFYETTTGHQITLVFAGSSTLARQIQQGAPADIFISANAAWMDVVQQDGGILAESRFDLVGNRLVLIGQSDADPLAQFTDVPERLGDSPLAMALVDAVPAGIYGKAALDHFGIWADVMPYVAQSDNVRAALALVALGEAPLGIVYASDAVADDRVNVVATFPTDSHPAIRYPAASTGDNPLAASFLDHLKGEAAQAVFARQGFLPAGG